MYILAGIQAPVLPILIFLLLLIVGIVCLCLYFIRKRTVFRIDYAGGNIGFDLRWITMEESENFQKVLRMCKDLDEQKAKQNENAAVNANNGNNTFSSVPDELRKYNELFTQGIITKEEFEAKKKQLLGL